MVFHSFVHISFHTRAYHIYTPLLTHSVRSNGGNCKAISHFHIILFATEISQIKLQIGLILWNVWLGFVLLSVDHVDASGKKPTLTHTPTRIYQNWYDKKRIWDIGRPLADVVPTTDAITKHQITKSIYYRVVVALYHCECVKLNRGLFIFLADETIAIAIKHTPVCNNRFHKTWMKIHCEFDWLRIFHRNPIVPIRYRSFLFVVCLYVWCYTITFIRIGSFTSKLVCLFYATFCSLSAQAHTHISSIWFLC